MLTPFAFPPSIQEAMTVRELTARIKEILDTDPGLRNVVVRGEVSNLRDHPSSGHLYFTLKDESSAIRCVMFRSRRELNRRLAGFILADAGGAPRNGEVVLAQGYVSVYERDGQYQLYVEQLWRDGELRLGELYRALEELKARLKAEGLFDESRKRPLPLLPRKVGIVTSPTAAALRDILRVGWRRFPNMHFVLIPALVQGEKAPADISRAIALANRWQGVDVLIVGRGGGSLEELWAFNTEEVARAIAASHIPVVSAVGHETDFTVADLAADVRAPTPSGAAEIVVPDKNSLVHRVHTLKGRLGSVLRHRLDRDRQRLGYVSSRPVLVRPFDGVNQRRQRVDDLQYRLRLMIRYQLDRQRHGFIHIRSRLEGLNPLAVLERGYSMCLDARGCPVTSYRQVVPGDQVRVVLRDGEIEGLVKGARPGAMTKGEGE